jgi:putative phosphoribosyl transferase
VDRVYADRAAAGEALAERLSSYADRHDVVVLGLPRGGVVVAAPIAARLHAPLDLVLVRKLSVPGRPELAMGAVAEVGGERQVFRHDYVFRRAGLSDEMFQAAVAGATVELRHRRTAWGSDRRAVDPAGLVVVLVDDGLATGSTMRAAVAAVQHRSPAEVVVAVPVAAPDVAAELTHHVDRLVCPLTPVRFHAVGEAYLNFAQVEDEEVRRLLSR